MKRASLIAFTFFFFALSLYVAFIQGSASFSFIPEFHLSAFEAPETSRLFYSGVQASVAGVFSVIMNFLMGFTGGQIFWAIVWLALIVEVVLLYPSVRLQLKQKKIHLFHKKLVDRFHTGELSFSQTEQELGKLYAVNEKIHARGAVLVTLQAALLLAVFFGLDLMVKAPVLLKGSWSVLNFNLLNPPAHFLVPVLLSLLYFLHALIKIYSKEREDYISPGQTLGAILFAVFGSTLIYFFAGTFAVALSLYVATLLMFSTLRYVVVEQHAQAWGVLAQKELIEMLQQAKPHHDRFEYVSQKWNHLPVVRYINFHLLEEALSMSLGLLLALNFFGVFQKNEELSANVFNVPRVMAVLDPFPPAGYRFCTDTSTNSPICNVAHDDDYTFLTFEGLNSPDEWLQIWDTSNGIVNFINHAFTIINPVSEAPRSCCLALDAERKFQVIRPPLIGSTQANLERVLDDHDIVCAQSVEQTCADLDGLSCERTPGCNYVIGLCLPDSDPATSGSVYVSSCNYRITDIPRVAIASGCSADPRIVGGPAITLTASGGSGYYQWTTHRFISGDEEAGPVLERIGDGTSSVSSRSFTFTESGFYKVAVSDYFNSWNSTYAFEGGDTDVSCLVHVRNAPLVLDLEDQLPVSLRGSSVQLEYEGGPADRNLVTWELVSGPGMLNPDTGVYTPSADPADLEASIFVKAYDEQFADNVSNTLEIPYGDPNCNPQFGLYYVRGTELLPLVTAGHTVTKNVFTKALYRYYIRNAIAPTDIDGLDTLALDPDSIIASYSTGVFDYDIPYIDLRFSEDADLFTDTVGLTISDPNIAEGSTCEATVNFVHGGLGVRARAPKKINITF